MNCVNTNNIETHSVITVMEILRGGGGVVVVVVVVVAVVVIIIIIIIIVTIYCCYLKIPWLLEPRTWHLGMCLRYQKQ